MDYIEGLLFVSNILIYNFLDKAPLVQLFIVHSGKDDYFHFSEYWVLFGIGSEKVSFFFTIYFIFATIHGSYCTFWYYS